MGNLRLVYLAIVIQIFCGTRTLASQVTILAKYSQAADVFTSQILFLKEFFPEKLKIDSKLYNDSWVSLFAAEIYQIIEKQFAENKKFSLETAKALGAKCQELLKKQ